MHHLRGRQSKGFNFQVCNVRFPIVSVYRLTQAACKLEVKDSTTQLRPTEKGTLDLDLIGGTLRLELCDHRPFVCSQCKHVDLSCQSRKIVWFAFGKCV